MPITEDQAFLVARASAHDREGRLIGAVSGVFYDDHTGRPEWVTVTPAGTGGTPAADPDRFIPLASASYSKGRLNLNVTLAQVHAAPAQGDGDHLDGPAETALYRHYGLSPAGDTDVDPRSGSTPRTEGEPGEHTLLPPSELS